MDSPYKVPLIPFNLRTEETIIQIADVINYLSLVTDDVIKRVNLKISSNQKALQHLTDRMNEANNKVYSLNGATKAIQVFSSSKYPANHSNQSFKSVFAKSEPLELKRSKVPTRPPPYTEESLDPLHFYHVKQHKTVSIETTTGLGQIPHDTIYVNDLLLYNTGKNLYKTYELSDATKMPHRNQQQDTSHTEDIGAAPVSISEHPIANKTLKESYFYSPDMGDVPVLDVPLDLPDLPGIADDLRFITSSEPGIAPSAAATPIVPDLPTFEEISPEVREVVLVVPEVPLVVEPPPVTIPEPEPEPEPEEPEPVPVAKLEVKTPVIQDDAHASLMEAIRNAGGLKSAKLKKTSEKNKEVKVKVGGDLMADLHAKLAMRRKGILGAKNQDGGSAMEKVSAMIPPPPQSNSDKTSEDEDGWEE